MSERRLNEQLSRLGIILRSSGVHIVFDTKTAIGVKNVTDVQQIWATSTKSDNFNALTRATGRKLVYEIGHVRGSYAVMKKNGSHLGWLAAGLAVSGLAMTPAIARVISDNSAGVSLRSLGSIGSFTVAGADPELAAKFKLSALRGKSNFKFTPVGGKRAGDRSVTVVVRQPSSEAVSVRENIALAGVGTKQLTSTKITPTSYSLGAAKGLKSFAIPVKQIKGNMPDLSEIGVGQKRSDTKPSAKKSRFNTRFSLDARSPVEAAPRALDASEKDYTLDVGGSYSVTKNLAVTAGVRYNNERDRMAPLTDSRQDSQAVYVGTQFRF